jgi:hypothetical protein
MNEPLFVRFEKGIDTAGSAIFEIRCICEHCRQLTAPIHVWKEGENYDTDIALAELGMNIYAKELNEEAK